MSLPVFAQDEQCFGRKRNIAVFGSLSSVDVDHHSFAVNIRDLQEEPFMKTQATAVDGDQVGTIMEGMGITKHTLDFFQTKDGRKTMLCFSPDQS